MSGMRRMRNWKLSTLINAVVAAAAVRMAVAGADATPMKRDAGVVIDVFLFLNFYYVWEQYRENIPVRCHSENRMALPLGE